MGKRRSPTSLAFFGRPHPAPRWVRCPAFTGSTRHCWVNKFPILRSTRGGAEGGKKALAIPGGTPLGPQPLATSRTRAGCHPPVPSPVPSPSPGWVGQGEAIAGSGILLGSCSLICRAKPQVLEKKTMLRAKPLQFSFSLFFPWASSFFFT